MTTYSQAGATKEEEEEEDDGFIKQLMVKYQNYTIDRSIPFFNSPEEGWNM